MLSVLQGCRRKHKTPPETRDRKNQWFRFCVVPPKLPNRHPTTLTWAFASRMMAASSSLSCRARSVVTTSLRNRKPRHGTIAKTAITTRQKSTLVVYSLRTAQQLVRLEQLHRPPSELQIQSAGARLENTSLCCSTTCTSSGDSIALSNSPIPSALSPVINSPVFIRSVQVHVKWKSKLHFTINM